MILNYNHYVCECGCGELVPPGSRFVRGHNLRVNNPMEDKNCVEKMKISQRKVFSTKEYSQRRSEISRKISKELWKDPKFVEKHKKAVNKVENVKNNSEKIKELWQSSWGDNMRKIMNSEDFCQKNSQARKENWQKDEYVFKQMKARHTSPNDSEKFLKDLLKGMFKDSWIFVGDGKLIIGGKCPDFIHVSKPLIIELFGSYWHSEERTGQTNEDHEQERIKHFKSYKYETLIVWEHELKNKSSLKTKVQKFLEKASK